jgi:predicted negative regulator of RcsB-dependent stress response
MRKKTPKNFNKKVEHCHGSPMPLSPLEVLKKGLALLSKRIQARKKDLNKRLARQERISEADEEWLDNEGNTVAAQCVVDILASTPDYEEALKQLDEPQKAIVANLQELAGDLPKTVGNKRKCTFI